MQPGDRVRIKINPSRIGVLTSDPPIGEGARKRLVVHFPDGVERVLASSLEKVVAESQDAFELMQQGRYGGVSHLRGAITQARLSGKLANLIYSLNTTNTKFLPYQFKPVLQYLDSPSRGIIIADEVGLGKTIEAGLIWTELRARQDARRLLVVCPAMLREKWCDELYNRFGVKAEAVDANGLLQALQKAKDNPMEELALVVSMQGTRPPGGWDSTEEPSKTAAARLARFLQEMEGEEPLLDLVVVDEAHYLRNRYTQTHRFASLLRPVTDGLVLLSATPIQMKSTDLFNLLYLLDQDAFPLEWIYDLSVRANAPIVALRDRLQREPVRQLELKQALEESLALRWLDDNEQINYLLHNLPSDEVLASYRGRAEYAEQLDRVNPRAKVITRTLKRDVHELRVQREPVTLRVTMSEAERVFYDRVTEAVREYSEDHDGVEGFLLTIPQRQMSSCMAGAYENWTGRLSGDQPAGEEEFLTELVGESVEPKPAVGRNQGSGELLRLLAGIARETGAGGALLNHDSKFDLLHQNLKSYWQDNPNKKVVLFAFYRNTLYYLARRLAEHGVTAAVLHGGMDKQAVLDAFKSDDGPRILLSSEVASEGVDLQFSSLLVNYDIPWNPAKIEQRIGRIDRIGQEAEKILIWNLIYEDTLDERVYERLLSRLNVFKSTLGAMEEILGEEVRQLTRYLLSHKLSPLDEERRIEQSALAIENLRRTQDELDSRAAQLLGHGDFIQNKAKAAHELGRYIRGEDLFHYVKDFLESKFPGSRLVVSDELVRKGKLELSIEAKTEFSAFLADAKLIGRTAVLASSSPTLWFDNQLGNAPRGVEKVTQDHPLIRFIADRQNAPLGGTAYFPTSAIELPVSKAGKAPAGTYVYLVMRWTFSGPRDVEKLVYAVRCLETGAVIEDDDAELLINSAALDGRDWHGVAQNVLDHRLAAELQDDCRASIEGRYHASMAAQLRENRDRIREMNASLDQEYERKKLSYEQAVEKYQGSSNPKHKQYLTMERGKLRKLEEKHAIQKGLNASKENLDPRQKEVSSGVIKVS